MKLLLLNLIKGWLVEQALHLIIKPLRKKVEDTENKWDDAMVDEVESLINTWLK